MSSTTSATSLLSIERNEFELFRTLIHQHTGIWLRDGKQVMLASRLTGRMRLHGMTDFADYYAYVARHPDDGKELGALINCVTTNKTSFFRENHHFEFLSDVVVPEIVAGSRLSAVARGGARFASSPGRKTISIWSAACSTGEEPYSIAITLLESLDKLSTFAGANIRIAASDIDTTVLNKAVRGIYREDELESVEPVLQKKYFLRGKDEMSGQIKVKKQVTSLVEFRRINLMDRSWQLDGPFDAIFFRNALIYFQQDVQDLFLRRMVRYLKPGGYLFLGHSEHIPWLHDILEPLQKTVYRLRVTRE